MNPMRKILSFCLLLFLFSGAVGAQNPKLHRHITNVTVYNNYMIVVQAMDVTLGNEYSELSIPIRSQDLFEKGKPRVTEAGSENTYEFIGDWNSDASYEEKQNRCGLKKASDTLYKLCFGVKRNTRKTYFVTYALKNLLYTTPEADILDYPFISHSQDFPAMDYELRVQSNDKPLTEEDLDLKNSQIHGATVQVKEGKVCLSPPKKAEGITSFPFQLRFRKGTFPHLRTNQTDASGQFQTIPADSLEILMKDSFTEAEMQSTMMKTSSLETESAIWGIIDFILDHSLLLITGLFALVTICYIVYCWILKKVI